MARPPRHCWPCPVVMRARARWSPTRRGSGGSGGAGASTALAGLVASRQAEGGKLQVILAGLLEEIAALRDAAAAEAVGGRRAAAEAAGKPGRAARRGWPRPRAGGSLAQEVALLAREIRRAGEALDRLAADLEAARACWTRQDLQHKLDLLTRDSFRGANTLCAKSASVPLTRIGLDLKAAAMEQLEEQATDVGGVPARPCCAAASASCSPPRPAAARPASPAPCWKPDPRAVAVHQRRRRTRGRASGKGCAASSETPEHFWRRRRRRRLP